MIYSLFRFGNKGQKWVKKSVILGVNGLKEVVDLLSGIELFIILRKFLILMYEIDESKLQSDFIGKIPIP